MASGMWKHIRFYLSGGLPTAARYEQRQRLLKEQHRQYEEIRALPAVERYYELAGRAAMPRRQSGLSKQEHRALKQEVKALQKDPSVVTLFRLQKKTRNFEELLMWDEFFYEDFAAPELDPLKWMVRRCAAHEQLPEIQYSPAEDRHLFACNGENLHLTGSSLQVLTKKEPAEGLVFSSRVGFAPAKRNFTAGIVNTGDTCRLIYGRVEVKFRYRSASRHVYHSIWMSGGRRLPHINLLRIGKKVEFGAFAAEDNARHHWGQWRRRLLRPNTDYILRLLWTKDLMEWRINGKKMFSAPNAIHEPMFLAFSSGVAGGEPRTKKTSTLEIKWVKMAAERAFG